MRQKPCIKKMDGSWYLIQPTFGFRSSVDMAKCASWKDAIARMTDMQQVRTHLSAVAERSSPKWTMGRVTNASEGTWQGNARFASGDVL
ncbi:MAG TPA: hypothetical protein VHV10_18895 [Ktedonobacteraceae bacterium]|jgi:hypothetical protein|nr:hypothetical protein [Ktedonobacteraceae bacterium]